VDEVVAETGWPADKVARYAEPPLRERAYIVELAQRAYVRGTTGTTVLLDVVTDTWRGATWDAYRAEDGRWRVTASRDRQKATWIYEPTGRTVQAVDAAASRILGAEVSEVGHAEQPTMAPVEERPKLLSVPTPPVHTAPPAAHPPIEEPRSAKKGRRGRARVPSWDEILFGATRSED
jgi:hypothetical protein